MKANRHDNIVAGIVVEFSELGQVYFMPIDLVNNWFMNQNARVFLCRVFKTSHALKLSERKRKSIIDMT